MEAREERTRHILSVSLGIFARKGLDGTRISDIAEAAGVSQGHIYNFYPSKQELYVSAVYWSKHEYGDICKQALHQPGNALDKLSWHLMATLSHPQILEITMLISHAQMIDAIPHVHEADLPRSGLDNLKPLIQIIMEGQQEGTIRGGNPVDLAVLYFSLIVGFVISTMRGYSQVMEHHCASIIHLLRP